MSIFNIPLVASDIALTPLYFSLSLASMTIVCTLRSHTILQKSFTVSANGASVAMNPLLLWKP